MQLGMESLKGIGHGLAATVLIAWMFQNSSDEVPLAVEIIVAAITAAILFDPVVTGTRLVKRWFRIASYRVDDTDALWEADWQTSRERRRRKARYLKQRRWIGATIGAVLGAFPFSALMVSALGAYQERNISFDEMIAMLPYDLGLVILMIAGLAIATISLVAWCGFIGHQIEKALWPKPDENPMRRDDW